MAGGKRRGSTILKALVILVIVGGLGVGGVLLAGSNDDRSSRGRRATDVALAQVISFDISVTASGELEAKRQLEIKNPLETSSRIAEIVPEGTTVAKGDLLVRLNTDDLEQRIRQEELSVISARNDLDQAEGDFRIQLSENRSRRQDAELQVNLAELALQRWREGEVAKRREQLRIAFEKARDELARLGDKLERTEELYEQKFKSKDELDQVRIQHKQAIADHKIAELDIEIYESFQYPEEEKTKLADVEKAKASLERTLEQNEINLKNKEALVQTRKEQLRLRDDNLAKYRQQFDAATITAPKEGLVVYATSIESGRRGGNSDTLDVGTDVYPNQLLIVLPDTSEMVASVRVHESLAGRIRPGQRASVKIEAVGRTIPGVVRNIGVMAESGGWRDPNRREYTVKIDLAEGGEGGLKPSMRCDGTIVLDRVENALAVPLAAVFSDGPVQFVYVPRDSRYDRRPVQLGKRSDLYAEIVEGIEQGQSVLLRQPAPGEVISRPWTESELLAAGYEIDEEGKPALPGRILAEARDAAPPARQQRPEFGRRPGQRPQGGDGRPQMRSPAAEHAASRSEQTEQTEQTEPAEQRQAD